MDHLRSIPNDTASDADYAQLRALFESSGFTLPAICRRLKIGKLSEVDPLRNRLSDFGVPATAADGLIHLFVEGKPIEPGLFTSLAGLDAISVLERLNLIFPLNAAHIAATVALYPIEHVYIASDRYNSADGSQFEGFDDIVYPCLFETSARFIRILPRTSCGPVLDLCSGTGVAALLLARTSEHTYAADLTERCRQFALFNQRMNGIQNSSVAMGDLYQPVAGLTFDRIVVHPPYQPVFRHQQIFNSGGVDGEQITRRCVEESYAHLRPGGRLYCLAQITAREQPVDQRVRQWLADKGATDCDIGFYITKRHEIELFAAKATLTTKGNELDFREWLRAFARMGVRSLDYGLLIVERHAAPREPFSVCLKTPDAWDPADFEVSFAFEIERRSAGFESQLWGRKPRLTPTAKLEVEHGIGSAGWQLNHYRITQSGPFDVKIQASQGLAQLLALFDGTRTVERCFQELTESGAGVERRPFVDTVVAMASEGFLRL